MSDIAKTTRRSLLGFLAAAPAVALAGKAPARQADMFTQLSREEINKRGMGIEADTCLIEIRLAIHEYRIRHGKDHWRNYISETGAAA